MKTILLLALTLIMSMPTIAQETSKKTTEVTYKPVYTTKSYKKGDSKNADKNTAMYLVGTDKMKGYDLEIKSCSTENIKKLSNGKTAPALNCFIIDKNEYIGGDLVFGKKKTEIVDIVLEPAGKDGAVFTVKGKKFNMSFTLLNGMILKIGGDETVFHTGGKGAWKIKKKA